MARLPLDPAWQCRLRLVRLVLAVASQRRSQARRQVASRPHQAVELDRQARIRAAQAEADPQRHARTSQQPVERLQTSTTTTTATTVPTTTTAATKSIDRVGQQWR